MRGRRTVIVPKQGYSRRSSSPQQDYMTNIRESFLRYIKSDLDRKTVYINWRVYIVGMG